MNLKKIVVQGYETLESVSLTPKPTYIDKVDNYIKIDGNAVVTEIDIIINGADSAGNVYTGNGKIIGSTQKVFADGNNIVLENDETNVLCEVVNSSGTKLPSVFVNCKIVSANQTTVSGI